MQVTYQHDGTGFRPEGPPRRQAVQVIAYKHAMAGERMEGRNWIVWPPREHPDAKRGGSVTCDTFAEAVHVGAMFAADLVGGVELTEVAGVEVPHGWDAVDALAEGWQDSPPFAKWTPEAMRLRDRSDALRWCETCRIHTTTAPGNHAGEFEPRCSLCGSYR